MNSFLFLLAFSPLLLLINATTYYVNEQSVATSQTGSLTNPFTSIDQAYSSLGPITCDLVLLGSSASIGTTIAFKDGANYTIRPDPSFTSSKYFPINLNAGAAISITKAILTLQNLQLVELNPSRSAKSPLFSPYTSSTLTFQSVLLRDIRTTDTYYFFCDCFSSFVNIFDSEFRNLTNLQFFTMTGPIVVRGSRFVDINQLTAPLFWLIYYTGPYNGFTFKNNSFENIVVGNTTGGGLIYSSLSRINVAFEDFYLNNITFAGEDPFIITSASTNPNYDSQGKQTSLIIRNGVIENMFEKHGPALKTVGSPAFGLFVHSNGPTILKVHNLSLTNVILTNLSLVSFTAPTNNFLNTWKILPSMELRDITLKYTRNSNFLLFNADTADISNVYLEGISTKDVTITYPMFRLSVGHALNVYNITANNVTGPLFQAVDVLAHNFSIISLNNMSTFKEGGDQQNIIAFVKVNNLAKRGLDLRKPQDSLFDQITLNGFTSIYGTDFAKNSNKSFFLIGHSIYGKVYLKNSVWHNNFMSGFYTNSLPYFEVDNLTISHDPDVPRAQIPIHKGFYLVSATEVVFKNSRIQNNQNYVFLDSYNIARRSISGAITETFLTFENITILNNSAVYDDKNTPFSSLFIIYCPQKPITVAFHNSYFYNNTILNGLINALENYQANIDFTNNTFDNNYATQAAAVFSSRNMRQKTSTLNLTNNIFTNNKCDQHGGVFSFILTDYNMHPVNNTYQNNTAGFAGGVGYAFRASFVFLEEEGTYLNNSAGSFGGVWYMSLNTYKSNLQSLEFTQTSFTSSVAKQKGGSIYLENLGMTINQCTFQSSQAGEAGGNFYVTIGKSINIIDTNFTSSSASQGSFLYAEEISGTLTINNVQVKDLPSSSFAMAVSSGSLGITDSVFENIDSPLFLLSNVTTFIDNTTFNKVSCPKTSNSFCLLKSTSSSSIKIANSSLTNFQSNVDLISLSDCTQALLYNITAQDMFKLTPENLDQIFVLNSLNIRSLNIDQSDFSKIGFSGVKTKNTSITIQESTFSNILKTTGGRLLRQNDDLNSAKLTQPIQFIVLDSSNSTITSISFIENSLNTLVDGGGIQILGSGGVHTLTDCIFENNQASNGGALFVKGQANSVSILNSQFSKNQATGNGGALAFFDQSIKTSLFISQSIFFQNKATLGGALYLENQALVVDSSSFIENNALRGGAIATLATKTKLVDLRQSTFASNNASEGAALIALQEMNFDYSTSSFKQNTAVYGGNMASLPTSLRLRIYHFESYFLYLDNITAQDLLSHPSTTLIYDSATAGASDSVAFISGAQPNLLFEVTILDAFGQKMGQTNNAQGEFKISSSSSSSSLVGMLGSRTFTFTDSMAYIFKAFSVKGPFEKTVTLSIQGTYFSQSSNSFQSLPSLKFPIILNKCSVGQIYDKSSAICSSCSSTTYSLEDPLKTQTCQSCLDHAVCLGSIMYPAEGYWRIDEFSENLIKCPQSNSCLGGSKDEGKNISLTGFCGEGYEGVACSGCAPGYARFGSSQSCVNCKESKLYYVMFVGYLLIQAIAIAFSVKVNLKGSKENNNLQKNSVLQSTLMKIVIDFVQILTLISEFNFDFPSVVDSLYYGVTKIIPTNLDAVSVDCFIALQKGTNKHIFFNKVLVVLAEPFAFMIFAYIIWSIIFRRKKASTLISKNPEFKFNILLTIIVIIYVLQPGLVKIMFGLFNCKNYGTSDDPKYYLVHDVNVECWKPEHLAWGLSIALPTLIVGLVVPFGILAYWTQDKDLKTNQKAQKVYAFIFKSYQNNALFWEKTIMARKVLLILISVFITSQYLQAYLSFLLLALYYCLLIKISPYNNPQLNLAEAISVVSSAFILYTSLYFVQVDNMDTTSYILFACDIISGLAFVLFSAYAFFKIFRKPAAKISMDIPKIDSKLLTNKISNNLKLSIQSHHSLQTLGPPPVQSPPSLKLDLQNDSPISSERIVSTDRPFSPFIKICRSESIPQNSEDSPSSERREDTYTDTPVFSPANLTGAELLVVNIRHQRGLSIPIHLGESETPAEDQFSEMLKDEMMNSPPHSVENRASKVLKFSQEAWTEVLSKKKSRFGNQ